MIYIQGTFDLFHTGHINLLKRCSELDSVFVSLLTDEAILKYRGKPPIIKYEDRAAVLLSCRYVDRVIPINDVKNTKEQIGLLNPDYIAVGTDWAKKDIYKQYGMTREELDSLLIFFPYTKHISSTSIKKKIHDQS